MKNLKLAFLLYILKANLRFESISLNTAIGEKNKNKRTKTKMKNLKLAFLLYKLKANLRF